MESGRTSQRPSWAGVGAPWLRLGARGSAVATVAPSYQGLTVSLPGRGRGGPALLLEHGGTSLPQGTSEQPQQRTDASTAPDSVSASQTGDVALASGAPRLHFCEDTNEPEDVCNAQWLVLWSYASYAPGRPSEDEQRLLRTFFEFFPDQCTEGPAANCYAEAVRSSPPRVSDRRELLLWLCMVENQCRLKAGMAPKRCRHNELMKRWRYTDGYV